MLVLTQLVCGGSKTIDSTPWTVDQPVTRPLPTQTPNKRRQTFMSSVGFEHTISVFERVKTVHALDCAATLIGMVCTLR
jgi:hypothetical protein